MAVAAKALEMIASNITMTKEEATGLANGINNR